MTHHKLEEGVALLEPRVLLDTGCLLVTQDRLNQPDP